MSEASLIVIGSEKYQTESRPTFTTRSKCLIKMFINLQTSILDQTSVWKVTDLVAFGALTILSFAA